MAECLKFVCNNCSHTIEAWSDGNPYYIDKSGCKKYTYHPDPKMASCIGNDAPHICLSCRYEFSVDSREPISVCPSAVQQILLVVTSWMGFVVQAARPVFLAKIRIFIVFHDLTMLLVPAPALE